MRSELETLEQIDQYLGGKMSAENAASFEAEIAADPKLQSLVKDQQLLIQTVNRQALMAEINSVAGLGAAGGAAGATGWGIAQWAITALIVGVVGVGGYFIYDNYQTEDLPIDSAEEFLTENVVETEPKDTGDYISFSMVDDVEEEVEVIDASTQEKTEPKIDKVDKPDRTNQRNDNLNTMVPFVTKTDVNTNNSDEVIEDDLSQTPVHNVAKNRKATFPGGLLKMKAFFKKEMRYPRTPKDKGLAGTVKVNFIVTADGKIMELSSNCFILKDREGLKLSQFKFSSNGKSRRIFEDKAEGIFRKSSPWTPATNAEGNPTLSEQTWYVNFDLKGESSIYQLEDDVLHEENKNEYQIKVMPKNN